MGAYAGAPSVRVYLAGRVAVEAAGRLIGPEAFPGQQGRVAFAYLVLERDRPVTREELAEALWPQDLPSAWESALNAIASKLRGVLARLGVDKAALLGARGSYELRLPGDTWVDVEVAADAIHDAETALRAGDPARAYGPSAVAHHVARRPFLPGERSAWV
jgi:SARP family transcriptional regulator, regulator of embCAB operon